jgi:CxxC motif-containing protein (DUF1111 family)
VQLPDGELGYQQLKGGKMKYLKLVILVVFVAVLTFATVSINSILSKGSGIKAQGRDRGERMRPSGGVDDEGPAADTGDGEIRAASASEAPTGFDNRTNGFNVQGPDFDTIDEDNVVPLRSMNDNRFIFEEAETIPDGLGPTYNGQSCRECHQNVVTGGASQVAEHRTGRTVNGSFDESLGGSLIQSRGTHPDIVERVPFEDDVETFRISTNTLGNGFIECIANSTLQSIRDKQPGDMRGLAVIVPVLEARNAGRIGRFGWKSQHASLESFSGDAYLNEMGITTPLFPNENESAGRFVGFGSGFDPLPEPEDDGIDVVAFANFMRSTKAPSRGPITNAVLAGQQLFNQIGCAICHIPSITTAAPGTRINGGAFTVPNALGDKVIHPFSDFLLHDIGTGDGVPISLAPEFANTANKMRTAPLWALRTRNRLMHDGLSFTKQEAIERHGGQAAGVRSKYNALSNSQKTQLLAFLDSL